MSIFEKLKSFIENDMSMQHIYQPAMLIELLKNEGFAAEEDIAKIFSDRDPTQIKYYVNKVRKMVGEVLANNGITRREKKVHLLNDYSELSKDEINALIELLESKLFSYEDKHGKKIWQHRSTDREAVSGSIRYQVILRAGRRCEACGESIENKPIDVDHIIPRSLGGKNDISNYQALCWECNTNKGNRYKTNFKELEKQYQHREKNCLFCNIQTNETKRIVEENTLAYVVLDAFAITANHSLIIPKRHVKDYFELTQAEINAVNQLIQSQKLQIDKKDKSVSGYNIGVNCGEAAGQTIFHCHIHLIPRRKDDVESPRGGIRNIIPGKGSY
ncbi:HNH nuclease [Candidatus Methylopumilus universalis]|uniref:HIT domain-containing protein n=1 Tax=Candidatus Methylopumilus universalis TaxID=2588536 RepID=UPI003BEF02CC